MLVTDLFWLNNIFLLVSYCTNILSDNLLSLDTIFWVVVLRLNIIATSQLYLHIEISIIIDWVDADIPILQIFCQFFQLVFSRSLILSNCIIWIDDTYRTTCIAIHSFPNLCSNKWLAFIKFLWLLELFILICVCFLSGMNCSKISNYMLWVLMCCLDSSGARKCSRYFGFGRGRSIRKIISWQILCPFTSIFCVRTFSLVIAQRVHPSLTNILNLSVNYVLRNCSGEVRN